MPDLEIFEQCVMQEIAFTLKMLFGHLTKITSETMRTGVILHQGVR